MKRSFRRSGWILGMSISEGLSMKTFSLPVRTVNPGMDAAILTAMKWIAGATAPPVQSVSGLDVLSLAHRQYY
jgi:hypothetical protein